MGEIDERLAAIKREGHARRARRTRRNTTILGAAAMCVVGLAVASPWDGADPADDGREVAARGDTSACLNSMVPACGELRWEPLPVGNREAVLTVAPVGKVVAGEPVMLDTTWSDEDAPRASAFVCWGETACEPPPDPCVASGAAGAWTPPDPQRGEGVLPGLSHTYDQAGSFEVVVTLRTSSWPEGSCAPSLGDPYSDTVTQELLVVVVE